ncbi:hypothetical protein [Okeania sp. SIO2B3]|uniref:hypothetical protein n=1 Tax=Okeania sp. SIO2B3 TaxID=2607784 RepID=UPI0013C13489|nr:hypothetical protein [Okeania sp. SIO2B3]
MVHPSEKRCKWKDGQVYLAKFLEPLSIRWSRQLPLGCVPTTITVKLDPSSRWSVSGESQ